MQTRVHTCKHAHMHTCIHFFMHMQTHTHMHTYTWMYADMQTRIHAYMHMYVHTHIRIHIHIYIDLYIYIYIYMYIQIRTHNTQTYTYTYVHIHTHTYTYAHIRTHTCVRTYTHKYIHTFCYPYILGNDPDQFFPVPVQVIRSVLLCWMDGVVFERTRLGRQVSMCTGGFFWKILVGGCFTPGLSHRIPFRALNFWAPILTVLVPRPNSYDPFAADLFACGVWGQVERFVWFREKGWVRTLWYSWW